VRSFILWQFFPDLKPPTEHQQCTHKIKKNIKPHLLINMKQDLSNPLPHHLLIGGGQLSGCSSSVVRIFPSAEKGRKSWKKPKVLFSLFITSHLFFNDNLDWSNVPIIVKLYERMRDEFDKECPWISGLKSKLNWIPALSCFAYQHKVINEMIKN
jgi:hypothetical protein